MDGTIRAYAANGNLLWTYNFAQGAVLFASEPVVGDIDGDGTVVIVYGTYSPTGTANSLVGLNALHGNGLPVLGFPLLLPNETAPKKSIRAAPTIVDLDGDCKVEILAASLGGTVYAWDLPSPYYSDRISWPTGRHDNLRSGSFSGPLLFSSSCPEFVPKPNHVYLPDIWR